MTSFCFSTTAELTHVVRYLATYDDTTKFALTCYDRGKCTLRVTTAHVPPLSFSEVVFDNRRVTPCSDCTAAAHTSAFAPSPPSLSSLHKACWAVDARTLVRVLATFDARSALVVELCDDSAAMLLYQQTQDASRTRLARLDVLQDVSSELLVSHHVEQFYRIRDVHNFRRVCMAVACDVDATTARRAQYEGDEKGCSSSSSSSEDGDDEDGRSRADDAEDAAAAQCRMTLQWRSGGVCELVCETATVKASVRLCGTASDSCASSSDAAAVVDDDTNAASEECLCGLLRCADLRAFALLCRPFVAPLSSLSVVSAKSNVLAHVCVGFGDNGVALLRLQWHTCSGERTASLYFCRIAAD